MCSFHVAMLPMNAHVPTLPQLQTFQSVSMNIEWGAHEYCIRGAIRARSLALCIVLQSVQM